MRERTPGGYGDMREVDAATFGAAMAAARATHVTSAVLEEAAASPAAARRRWAVQTSPCTVLALQWRGAGAVCVP